MGIKNMAKKRAPMLVVAVAIAFPTAAISIRQMICIERSFVLDDVHVTMMEKTNVANWFDLVSKSVPFVSVLYVIFVYRGRCYIPKQAPSATAYRCCHTLTCLRWQGRSTGTSGSAG